MKLPVALISLMVFVSSFTTEPSAESMVKTGEKHFADKEYLKAIQDFTAAIALKSDYGRAYLLRAKAKIEFQAKLSISGSDYCFDLIEAMQFGEIDAEKLLFETCNDQCLNWEKALIDPDLVFCADFSSKLLTELPSGSEKLSHLFRVNLFNNRFTHISSAFLNFPALLILDLSSNRVSSIDPSLGNLKNLKELNLSKNQLMVLPDNIGNLTRIRKLDLHGNRLSELPSGFSHCQGLEHLDLSFNQFKSVPVEVLTLKKLKTLKLSGNFLDKKSQNVITESLYNTQVYF